MTPTHLLNAGTAAPRTHVLQVVGNAIVGGMETSVLRLVERLPPERFRLSALCPFESGFTEQLRARGVEVLVAPMPEDLSWTSLQMACAMVRAGGVDVLHAHMANAYVLASVVGQLTGRPVLTTIHARQLSVLDLEVQRATGSHVSVVCSHTYHHALGLGIEPGRLSCIVNGVDAEVFRPHRDGEDERGGLRAELGIAPQAPVVGAVARLSPEKGIDVFLRLALLLQRQVPEAHCVLVGDGPLRGEAEDFIARFGLGERLHLAGERADMPAIYRAFDVLASTSLTEAMPLALMEAMASELPTVATRIGGVPELIAHGTTGWLVGPRDFEGAADRVAQLLRDPAARRRMGTAARQRAVEHFSLARSVEQTASLLQRLAAGTERPVPRLGAVDSGAAPPREKPSAAGAPTAGRRANG